MANGSSASDPEVLLRFSSDRPPTELFPKLVQQLADGLGRVNLHLEPHAGGALKEGNMTYGFVTGGAAFELELEIRPVTWTESPTALVKLSITAKSDGSEIRVELHRWKGVLDAVGASLGEWIVAGLLPAVLRELAPAKLGEWFMDQQAGRPAGAAAIETYRDPTYHWPSFLLVLDRLRLTPSDRLLEVGCGGGALLKKALESGCTATGIDHSPEMVRLTREENRAAFEAGRLAVREGDAGHLPVGDGVFTSCVCVNAFLFFPDPVGSLREIYRSLAPGGRLAILTETPAARGTLAAPEPFASRGRFYEPDELAGLARAAGFSRVEVEEPSLLPHARAAGLPAEVVKAFEGTGGSLLLMAQKPGGPEP